ncbi:MAG: AsmA family protein [Chitinophagales bacterium]|nr:AsmA family protein [Chitinophagales bacterium]
MRKPSIRQILKYTGIVMLLLVVLLFSITGLIYYKAVSGQEDIPELAQRLIKEETGLGLDCNYYRFEYWGHFPFLSLQMKDAYLDSELDSLKGTPLVQLEEISLLFHPGLLLQNIFELQSVVLSEGHFFFYRDKNGRRNTDSLKLNSDRNREDINLELSRIQLDNVTFEYLDSLKNKHHKVTILAGVLKRESTDSSQIVSLQGACHFHHLLFKSDKGAYLQGTDGELSIGIELNKENEMALILPSSLTVNETEVALSGSLKRGNTAAELELNISTPSVLMENGVPLLTDHLKEKLKPFAVDQAFHVDVTIAGILGKGDIPVRANFYTKNARIATSDIFANNAQVKGVFDNTCADRPDAALGAKCLEVNIEDAYLLGNIPFNATFRSSGPEYPPMTLDGQLEVPLKAINKHLKNNDIRFTGGVMHFPFHLSGNPAMLFDKGIDTLNATINGKLQLANASLSYLPNDIHLEQINAVFDIGERDLDVQKLDFLVGGAEYQVIGQAIDLFPMLLAKQHDFCTALDLTVDTLNLDVFFPEREKQKEQGELIRFPVDIIDRFSAQGGWEVQLSTQLLSFRKLSVSDVRLDAQLLREYIADENKACIRIDSFEGKVYNHIPVKASLLATDLNDPQISMKLDAYAALENLKEIVPKQQLEPLAGELKLNIEYEGHLRDYFDAQAGILNGRFRGMAQLINADLNFFPRDYKLRDITLGAHFDEHKLYISTLDGVLNDNVIYSRGSIEGLLPFVFGDESLLYADLALESPFLNFDAFSRGQELVFQGKGISTTRIAHSIEHILEKIEGKITVITDELVFRDFHMTNVSFGAVLAQECLAPNTNKSCVDINNFHAMLWGSAPLDVELQVIGLKKLRFKADVLVNLPMLELNRMFPPGQFHFLDGHMMVDFLYEGYPDDQFDAKTNLLKASIKGKAWIREGAMDYQPRGFSFRHMNGVVNFNQEGLSIQHLSTSLNDNIINAKGKLPNFITFLLEPGQRLDAELELISPHFSFDRFEAPRKFANIEEGEAISPTQFTEVVDAALEQIKARLAVELDTISYRAFQAHLIDGVITMRPDYLRLDEVNMEFAEGRLALNGQVSGLEEHLPEIEVRAKFNDANLRKVFYAFDNFGQDRLLADNIDGTFSADIQYEAKGNTNYDLDPTAQKGSFHLKVENGELIEFPALQAMNGFLFKKRNMDHVRFASLENTFTLKGQSLLIDHFYIVSNVMDFGLQGTYNLSDSSDTRLLFEVPISNLFRKDLEIIEDTPIKGRSRMLPILLEAVIEEEEMDLNHRFFRGRWERNKD